MQITMGREPSIHITKSKLKQILFNIFEVDKRDVDTVTNEILKRAKPYSLTNRLLINQLNEKKVERINNSDISDASLFSSILLTVRRKMKHKGLTQIKTGSRDWLMVKEITMLANNFCQENDLTKRQGYIEFINIGVGLMGRFMLMKFLGLSEAISNRYDVLQELRQDNNKELTEKMHKLYQRLMIENTGGFVNYQNLPEKYVYFYRLIKEAQIHNLVPETYLKAQFMSFEGRNSYPDPIQLVGDKALNRVGRYLQEHEIKPTQTNINWSKIIKK